MQSKLKKLPGAALLVAIALFVIHGFYVVKYAVNVPYWDEWALLGKSALPGGLRWEWLWAQHNEHRIVTTKLLVWLLYEFDSWNIVVHQAVNFVIFGILLATLYRFVHRKTEPAAYAAACFFAPFLLSTLNFENLGWAFQTQFHFSLLFAILAFDNLFNAEQDRGHALRGLMWTGLSAISLSSGVVYTATLAGVYLAMKAVRAKAQGGIKRERWTAMAVLIGTIFILAAWMHGWNKVGGHPKLTFPYQAEFWPFFLNAISLGFGYETPSWWSAIPAAGFLVTAIAGYSRSLFRDRANPRSWACLGLILAILGGLAAITAGRAGFGVGFAKSSRYSEIALMLVPLVVAGCWELGNLPKSARVALVSACWIFCFVGFANNWRVVPYKDIQERTLRGKQCLRDSIAKATQAGIPVDQTKVICPDINPEDISEQLVQAQKLNVSFYQDLSKQLASPTSP